MYVLGAQKNRLTETGLLSTNNIYFGREITTLIFNIICTVSRRLYTNAFAYIFCMNVFVEQFLPLESQHSHAVQDSHLS